MPADAIRIRPAVTGDAAAIAAIYNHYVLNDTCTYQEEPDSVADRAAWIAEHTAPHVALVATAGDGEVLGWGSLSRFRARTAYRFTAEDSIYLRHDQRGRGLGSLLLAELIGHARQGGLHRVVAGISAEQTGSIALHRRFGFVEVARMPEVGFKLGRWLDLVYMQLGL